MAKIDLEAQAQAILNRERNGSKQFDVIVGNLMAMDSFLSTYKTLKSKGKLKGKKLEKVKALVEKVQAIRDHINDTIYKEQNRRNTIFRSTNEYQELETQFQEYDRIKNNPNVDTWRSSGDKYPADDPEDITELSDDDRRLVSHFRLIADSFGIPHSELCGKSLSDLEAFIDTKARRQQQLATTINKENGTLDKAVIDSDIAILADAKTAYEDYDRKKAAHDEYERKKAAHDEYERKKAAHDEYERKKAAYDAYERKKDAYDAYQHSNAYPALWNAQQIILDNPNHQDLFTLLPNSKEDIKKRLESYLEDPSISDDERAAIEMLIAENEFIQVPMPKSALPREYTGLWNAQQIILDNPSHQNLFTLLPNSKEDIKKRLESYLEDPSISDTERAAIEMLIAENEFTQLPSLEEPEVPGPAPEEPGPEPEKPGAEPEKPGTEPEKPGASLSPDAVNQMIQVLQAQNIAMQHLTLTEFTGIFNSDDKYKNLLNKIISISAIPEQDRTEEQKQLLKALKTLSTPRDDRFLTMFNPDDTSAPLDVRLAGACLRNGITLDPTDPSKSITDLSTKLTKIQGRTVSQEKNTARPNPLTPTALIDRTNKAKTEYGKIGDEIIPGKKEPYSALIDRIQQVGFSPVVGKQSFVYAHTVFKEQGRFKSFLNKVTYGKVFPKQVDRVEITEEPIAAIMADPLSAFKKALADARIKGRALGCFTLKNDGYRRSIFNNSLDSNIIDNFKDLLRAAEENPALADKVLREILALKCAMTPADISGIIDQLSDKKQLKNPTQTVPFHKAAGQEHYYAPSVSIAHRPKLLHHLIKAKGTIDVDTPSSLSSQEQTRDHLRIHYGEKGEVGVSKETRVIVRARKHEHGKEETDMDI